MTDSIPKFTQSLRDEIGALFGIRWTAFVEWVVIGWLSIWFWMAVSDGHLWSWNRTGYLGSDEEGYGPISGIIIFFQTANLVPPSWLSGFLGWMHNPANNAIYIAAILIAVTASVTAVRSRTYAGLRVLALLATAIACEVTGGITAVFLIVAFAAIPAAIGCVFGLLSNFGSGSKEPDGPYFFWAGIVSRFLSQIVFLFLQPLFAPLFLAITLVVTFQTQPRFVASEEISRKVIKTLKRHGQEDLTKVDALTQAASTAAISLAGNQSNEAREILNAYYFALELQEGGKRTR